MSDQLPMRFNGPAYKPALDRSRLTKQHEVIRELMLDGKWRTLPEIEAATGYPQASISAQLRHLRKPRFGSYIMRKRHRGEPSKGLYEYQVARAILGGPARHVDCDCMSCRPP